MTDNPEIIDVFSREADYKGALEAIIEAIDHGDLTMIKETIRHIREICLEALK